jgi:hydroxymethylpyrimidine pyrophosphatase-like HAD family hydrolase
MKLFDYEDDYFDPGPHKPIKVPCGPTVFIDVDDTLVMWNVSEGATDIVTIFCRGMENKLQPNQYNIELLKKLACRGHAIVVWSGGGSDWAEAVVYALGLEAYVHVITGKPQYYIDDIANPKEWIGKHGYFTLDGKKIHGDNLPTKED